jgi:hypothetical protein
MKYQLRIYENIIDINLYLNIKVSRRKCLRKIYLNLLDINY